MELVVFDLDGTLLNRHSRISDFTRNTLEKMTQRGIAYTLATGRTFYSAATILQGHHFPLPHIYSNGVLIWHPDRQCFSLENCLEFSDALMIMKMLHSEYAAPFVSATNGRDQHYIFHPELHNDAEKKLLLSIQQQHATKVLPIDTMPNDVHITNISMIGPATHIDLVQQEINSQPHLIAYSGPAVEGQGYKWMDIHHFHANKGSAVGCLRKRLGCCNIICFGDSDNDISMFAEADESYALANAKDSVKAAADHVIGHHDEDAVATLLCHRFNL